MSAYFDGGSGTFLYRDANLPSDTAWSIMCWCYPTSYAGWNFALSVGNTTGSSGYTSIGHYVGGFWEIGNQTYGAQFTVNPAASTDTACCALTCDGSTLRGYLRLAGVNSWDAVSCTSAALTVNQIRVGTSVFDGTDWFNGDIWNVKCWNRVLTADELLVESYYDTVKFPASINFHWPMYDATNWLGVDRSGNGNHAQTGSPPSITGDTHWKPWKPGGRIVQYAAPTGYTGRENRLYGVDARGMGHMVRR